jgi:hypothetical protein
MTGTFRFPRVQAVPEIGRASLRIDGVERVGYHFGTGDARPYLFPVIGASGAQLTRLGHPDPTSHEHQKSIWFGHAGVAGVNFWDERPNTDIRIRHRAIRVYHDGPNWGGLVADLDWWAEGRSILRQELIIVLEPAIDGGFSLDLQSRFESSGQVPVELGPSPFGFLGLQIAKTMSEKLGGGTLLDAEGRRGARAVAGQASRWIDASGPSAPGIIEGICVMDHPSNPNHPSSWSVGNDGLVSPSFNPHSSDGLARDHGLALRYRLLIHRGHGNLDQLNAAWQAFARTAPFELVRPNTIESASLRRGETSV